ncbi:MAG: IS5/IS1182 family transposase, partial [Pelomonas sp.]|nr:IS5/IS1182 family transposase [Roseateles sp.]
MSDARHQGDASAGLFEDLAAVDEQQLRAAAQARAVARREGAARLLQPNRKQIELRASDLESLLGEEHRARLVW